MRVLCIPGRCERFEESLGLLSWNEGTELGHVELTETFLKQSFSDVVSKVGRVIQDEYEHEDALLVGRSYGAWILLHALLENEGVYPGTVVLLSSVLGYGTYHGLHFIAPRADSFWGKNNTSPAKRILMIHSTVDEQCPCDCVERLRQKWNIELVTFKEGGHGLGISVLQDEVTRVIYDFWFYQKTYGSK